jgi:hypothetical protein
VNTIYLHRDDIISIQKFLDSFPDKDIVQITSDNSSGIGSIIKASVIGAMVNGNVVTVTKDIVDESSW